MKLLIILILSVCQSTFASVMGISTHPLNNNARVLSAEMTGYMSRQQELGMGLRYTQELSRGNILDFTASGARDARALTLGGGMDFEVLREDVIQPRISLKPYYQHQKFQDVKTSLLGVAPTIRKGLSIQGAEFFPYLALPAGIRVNNTSDLFVYYASLSLGASMPLPAAGGDKLLLSIEGNKDLGASSDYLGVLLSWVWN